MKPIHTEIEDKPTEGSIDVNGDFKFCLYASNRFREADGSEFDAAVQLLLKVWKLDTEVSLQVNLKIKDIYEDLFHMHNRQGKVHVEDMHLFEGLRKDCQWIVDQINALEITHD
jgi:hypothetical protein